MAEKLDAATQKGLQIHGDVARKKADLPATELETFLEGEQSRARVNTAIHTFTSMCWDKCIMTAPSSSFSRNEQTCLVNCVDRFLDTSLFMVKKIEQERNSGGFS